MEISEGEMIIGCQNREPSMVVFFWGGDTSINWYKNGCLHVNHLVDGALSHTLCVHNPL